MAEYKLTLADPKTGKCKTEAVTEDKAKPFLHKKIGDKIRGDDFGHEGYEFEITGGSDYCGFPMRKDVEGMARKKVLMVKGVGIRKNEKGRRVRKTVAANTIHTKTAQINLKVIKHGKTPLFEAAEAKADEKKE